ncbi:hypothetical protein Ahy_B03g064919 isoform C [Arachis hypogaea]|uniref:Uncharacterized protein n=1 Tax=Arachis hypogaea TaxID=3818 RepID=A0A445A0N0_ARAHY|nr:hypothetical protein Ahy_B03g064919 isoform C [Arachis hypogaea]
MECQSSKGQKVVRVFYGVDPSEAGAAFAYREPLKEAACLPGFVTYINISTNSFISLNDSYMYSAVVECYETLKDIIYNLLQDEEDKIVMENLRLNTKERGQRFVNIDTNFTVNKSVKEKVIRLHLLLTVKESAINVPQNLDARCRITFFANSLFMNMPKAPKVRNMLSFRLEVYRIKLSGFPVVIGEGKPENQNHAIIFTRGEALQTIDMNQDNYYEKAFKNEKCVGRIPKRWF